MRISEDYRSLNAQLHKSRRGYGAHGHKWAARVEALAREAGAQTILDYGTGKGTLVDALRAMGVECEGYDPAVRKWQARPEPADFIVCADVLEHVEPDCLEAVLEDIAGLMGVAGLFVISLIPSDKNLADGRNAHLIVESHKFWMERLGLWFMDIMPVPPRTGRTQKREMAVIVRRRTGSVETGTAKQR
jgi:2-polyprenyl-3-methyl-5-hydroxy-6-metoxy-1,4-benzoquinol methylase